MSVDRANVKEQVVDSIKAMKDGPRAMRMYMEMCVKCGTCASVCPVYFAMAFVKHPVWVLGSKTHKKRAHRRKR
jgi:heterodisulfide reductase subunit C